MRYYHRHSLFPLVVVILSLLLVGFMYLTFEKPISNQSLLVPTETQEVSEEDYKAGLKNLVVSFQDQFEKSNDGLSQLILVESALKSLLDLRVPFQYKDLHLEIVVALNAMKIELLSENKDASNAYQKLVDRLSPEDWLNN